MLNIDSTLFIQLINFIALIIILNFILYRPIRRILIQREEAMGSLEKAIEDFERRSEASEKGVEEGRVEARKEGFLEKQDFKAQGSEQEKGIMEEANSSVDAKLGAARKEMESRIAGVQKALEGEVAAFSQELAGKILGRSVQ